MKSVLVTVLVGALLGFTSDARGSDAGTGSAPALFVAEGGTLALEGEADGRAFAVRGLRPDVLARLRSRSDRVWRRLFNVYTGDAPSGRETKPPVLGTYALDETGIVFTPRFPLRDGLRYTAVFDVGGLAGILAVPVTGRILPMTRTFAIGEQDASPTTRVTRIFPTGDVPQNLLKFYIHFSAPMRRGGVYRHVHILDQDGYEVTDAILEMEPELWDPETRRLTLRLEPGRIKRGLRPNLDLGVPLVRGQQFRLVIDADMIDATGQPLVKPGEALLRIDYPDRKSPDPEAWRIDSPNAGSKGVLSLTFDEVVDPETLTTMVVLRRVSGEAVAGREEATVDGRRWMFYPEEEWPAGAYEIQVNRRLEDLAGNRLGRLFDAEMGDGAAAATSEGEWVVKRFVIDGTR